MADRFTHLSVHREFEAVKEAVALKAIRACAQWLHDHGRPGLARAMLADMIKAGDDDAVPR